VDGLHLETFSDLREARAALVAFASLQPSIPILASLTFHRSRRGFFTVMGDPLVRSLQALAAAGASVVGANCTVTSTEMIDLAAEARRLLAGTAVAFEWIPRAENARADRLANESMDAKRSFARPEAA